MAKTTSNFIWYELMTTDLDAASEFYSAVVGWSVQSSGQPSMDYRQWSIDGENVGGLMAIPADAAANGMRPAWLGYINVADVDDSVLGIERAGGAAHMPATDVPGVGRIAMVADPQGATFYVMRPMGEGASQAYAPGRKGHGGWQELHTTDWRAAIDFYSAQLGWRKSDAMDMGPMGTYQLFSAGGDAIGGMMNSPGFPQPKWLYYINVDDIDAAKNRVEVAGGAVTTGPHQVPTGDWMIHARDPHGALFGLLGPKKA